MRNPETGWSLSPFDPSSEEAAALWRSLAAACGGSLVQQPEFVFTCVETLGNGPLRLAVHRRDGRVNAAALVSQRPGVPEVFVEDQMPLGAWLQLPSEDVIVLARSLLKKLPIGLRLGISQLDSRFVPRPPTDDGVSTLDYIVTPWVDLEGSYDAYWAARGKNLRTNMRKQRDKLTATGVPLRMEILSEAADMARAVGDYAALESKGWKAAGGTAVSEEHPQIRFYRRMLERFAALGQARVYRYFFGEQLVASELCLRGGGEFVILKTTYDESTAPYSPASLMRQEMFERLFAEGDVRRVEFYGPLKDWHTRWTPNQREVYHVNVFSSGAVGRLARIVRPAGGRAAEAAELPAARASGESRAAD